MSRRIVDADGNAGYARELALEARRLLRNGSRKRGTNPRKRGTNPRAMGTNRSAGAAADVRRVRHLVARTMATMHAAGERWCRVCDDTGAFVDELGELRLCGHARLTSREAQHYIDSLPHAPTWKELRAGGYR